MWTEPILHVDMDSFFVEVERLADPSLRGIPAAVGGTGRRGVIASASYEARAFGVASAQPTTVAMRLCPHLKVIEPSHGRYGAVSAGVFELLRSFTPLVEATSMDEAFMDVTGLRRHYPGPVAVGERIRERIRSELGLPASVGVAATKMMAKIASGAAKPDGLRHIPVTEQLRFLHALPVEALWGVGPATMAGLARLGVVTVGDLAEVPVSSLISAFGPTQGRHLADLAHGVDHRQVTPEGEAKSISVERTFEIDLTSPAAVETELLSQAEQLAGRLAERDMLAGSITIKVRFTDFSTTTRTITVESPTRSARELFRGGQRLLDRVDLSRPVRLLGLGAGALHTSDTPQQLRLEAGEEWDRLADAVARVSRRFGERSLRPARLVTSGEEDTP